MPFTERKIILKICFVDEVISFEDDDLGSAINALIKIAEKYPNTEINFCNGGDRGKKTF